MCGVEGAVCVVWKVQCVFCGRCNVCSVIGAMCGVVGAVCGSMGYGEGDEEG